MWEGSHGKLHPQQLDHVEETNVRTAEILHHHFKLPHPHIKDLGKEENQQVRKRVKKKEKTECEKHMEPILCPEATKLHHRKLSITYKELFWFVAFS